MAPDCHETITLPHIARNFANVTMLSEVIVVKQMIASFLSL